MGRKKPNVLLVIPAYNEEQVLDTSIEVLGTKLSEMIESGMIGKKSGMLFIDDGSSDGTWEILRARFLGHYKTNPAFSHTDLHADLCTDSCAKESISTPPPVCLSAA